MSQPKVALIKLGYQDYAVPVARVADLISMLSELTKVEGEYVSGEGYVYWASKTEADDHTITLISAGRIKAEKPGTPPPVTQAPPAVVAVDTRIVAAPTSTEPINVKSVPPMRDFVDEFRHEDFAV